MEDNRTEFKELKDGGFGSYERPTTRMNAEVVKPKNPRPRLQRKTEGSIANAFGEFR